MGKDSSHNPRTIRRDPRRILKLTPNAEPEVSTAEVLMSQVPHIMEEWLEDNKVGSLPHPPSQWRRHDDSCITYVPFILCNLTISHFIKLI